MKKLSLALLTVAAVFGFAVNVNAMTESELLAKVSKTYTINGEKVKLKAGVVKEIKDYLNDFDLSEDECDYLSGKIDEAIAIAKSGTATNWNEMTGNEKRQIRGLVDDITNNTSVRASLDSNGNLTILDPKTGNVYAVIDDAVTTERESSNDGASTVNTAAYDSATIILGGISLIGLLLVTKKVVKANA